MNQARLNLYVNPTFARLLDERAEGANKSPWIAAACQRYAAIVDEEKSRLHTIFSDAEAAEIIAATTDRLLDSDTLHVLIAQRARSDSLIRALYTLTIPQRIALTDACERYHWRRLKGKPVEPTADCLFA